MPNPPPSLSKNVVFLLSVDFSLCSALFRHKKIKKAMDVSQLMQLMKDVFDEENCELLKTDLMPLEYVLPYISTILQDQLPEAARETLKVWLQLLHNCLTEVKSMLHRSDPPQRCLDCLMCNPGRLSKQIKK
jgi:hypothetical protein